MALSTQRHWAIGTRSSSLTSRTTECPMPEECAQHSGCQWIRMIIECSQAFDASIKTEAWVISSGQLGLMSWIMAVMMIKLWLDAILWHTSRTDSIDWRSLIDRPNHWNAGHTSNNFKQSTFAASYRRCQFSSITRLTVLSWMSVRRFNFTWK